MHFPPQDSLLFIEQHKSGFERPADVEFEDYTQGIKAATSDSSLNPPKVRAKLWPFSKKNKVNLHTSLHLNHTFNFKEFRGTEEGNNSRDKELLHCGEGIWPEGIYENSGNREQPGSAQNLWAFAQTWSRTFS